MPSLFGRNKQAAPASAEPAAAVEKEGGKGRPTPKRKEAEAAARQRARSALDEKAARQLLRERRVEDNRRMREALKGGDERYLPARDRGPVKRFIRDYVDSRLTVAEFLLLIMLASIVISYSGNTSIARLALSVQTVAIVLTVIDTAWLLFRLRRELRQRFPDAPLRGVNGYAVMRAVQFRLMRSPKRKVGLGGRPR